MDMASSEAAPPATKPEPGELLQASPLSCSAPVSHVPLEALGRELWVVGDGLLTLSSKALL